METILVVGLLVVAIVAAVVAFLGRDRWGWVAVACIAAALLVPHLGLH